MSEGDYHCSLDMFRSCSRSACNGELSDTNASLDDVVDNVMDVLLGLGVVVEVLLW